jgi:hypothetical protein
MSLLSLAGQCSGLRFIRQGLVVPQMSCAELRFTPVPFLRSIRKETIYETKISYRIAKQKSGCRNPSHSFAKHRPVSPSNKFAEREETIPLLPRMPAGFCLQCRPGGTKGRPAAPA